MLNFICSEDRLQASNELINRLCGRAKEGVTGQILLVPEQFSHETERKLCMVGGKSISRYAEVLSFSRLADRVFSLYGGVAEEYLDNGGRFLTACRAVEQVRSKLKYYASASLKPEFLQQLCVILEEFLTDCVTPDEIKAASLHEQGQFAQKLEELALLYESYLSVCKTGRNDPVTRLARLEQLLCEEDYAENHIFYIDGFSDFTAIEQKIVQALIVSSEEVTVALRLENENKSIFATCANTKKSLYRFAQTKEIPVHIDKVGISENRKKQISFAVARLFDAQNESFDGACDGIGLHRAVSASAECTFAAGKIKELTEQGYRYRDICVAMSDAGVYEQQLRETFHKAGICAYFAGNTPLLRQPIISALLACVRAQERFEYEDVLQYLKSSLCPLDADEVDLLEHYAFRWDISGSLWLKSWTMHPDGFGVQADEESEARLQRVNELRVRALTPLYSLHKALRESQNTSQMLLAICSFLEDVTFADCLQTICDEFAKQKDMQSVQTARQAYESLLDAMEQMQRILGDTVFSTERFAQIFQLLLSQYSVGTIPSALDAVTVGQVSAFRSKECKALLILGAEEGKLPQFSGAPGLLTDAERKKLLAQGLQLAPEQADCLEREMGAVHAAISCTTENLIVCSSSERSSSVFSKLHDLFSNLTITCTNDLPYAPDASSAAALWLANKMHPVQNQTLCEAVKRLGEHTNYELTPLSTPYVEKLYGNTLRLSASKIDCFAGCRFSYFLKYGIRAEEWKKATIEPSVFGTFVHDVLEHTVNAVNELGGFHIVSEETICEITLQNAKKYADEKLPDIKQTGRRFAYLFNRNLHELIEISKDVARELRLSQFEAKDTELRFDDVDGKLPPVRIRAKNGEALIVGSVDRVDLYDDGKNTYCRVIDYKTGTKTFDFSDVLIGKGLQMLIYLFALRQFSKQYYGKTVIPAGVMYVPAKDGVFAVNGDKREEKAQSMLRDSLRRKGLVLDDDAVLRAMEQQEIPEYLPCKVKKNGYEENLASREQFSALEGFVHTKISEMTDAILDGQITPNPISHGQRGGACDYCPYTSVCRFDLGKIHKKTIKSVKEREFWQNVEGGTENG